MLFCVVLQHAGISLATSQIQLAPLPPQTHPIQSHVEVKFQEACSKIIQKIQRSQWGTMPVLPRGGSYILIIFHLLILSNSASYSRLLLDNAIENCPTTCHTVACVEVRYTHVWPRHKMEMSGQVHAPAAPYSRYQLYRRPGGTQGRSGRRGLDKNPLSLPGIEHLLSSP
jgi:hypothetical protein